MKLEPATELSHVLMNIRAYDNFMQLQYKSYYEMLKQAIVPYGEHVIKMYGNEVVCEVKPKYVIGAYCTHRYNPEEHWRGGLNENDFV